MSAKSKIEWTEQTWNPTLGCSKISPGCKGCYAIPVVHRLTGNPNPKIHAANEGLTIIEGGRPNWTGKVRLVEERLDQPMRRRIPTTYFVNSLSDLFHEDLPDEAIDRVFAVMALCPQHTFQVLTKRANRLSAYLRETPLPQYGPDVMAFDGAQSRVFARMVAMLPRVNPHTLNRVAEFLDKNYPGDGFMRRWPLPNVWLGVSVENQQYADKRIPLLLKTPAAVRFLSVEPLLGKIDLMYPEGVFPGGPQRCCNGIDCGCMGKPIDPPILYGIDWVIVGGESGSDARPMDPDWARSIRDQCVAAGVPLFFKQWGSMADWDQLPEGTLRKLDAAGCEAREAPYRVGKHAAGRLLDGREWNEMPITGREK